MEKKELRKYIRELKRRHTPEEKREMSYPLWKKLEQNECFQQAEVVLGYWSMEDEVYTHDFIIEWAKEKRFYCLASGETNWNCVILIVKKPCVPGKHLLSRSRSGLCLRI